ncbi:alanine racemase [Aurantimonas endophytica]|uniref:D-serine deaminase-like pyridoxal phosphate-dependent protein n=1 Tax=Aurantimonas endophytica TaxID=1522175 RepID=A0A7W6HHN2_9HYPH|nr:alanine racemase [Aurantimonas endophytica]MBB4005377.1 D-serine deaminase-like pyridoxal phosphate-dependent protein [Aurantimonas endophytica]MCO6405962.1 D-TA family PLP-dependent enzyme [Aurantimonas endophytica]
MEGEFETPAVVIDLAVALRNIERAQAHLAAQGLAVRPHIKTHKLARLAEAQIAAGAVGITCQKIGEVEALLDEAPSIADVLLTYPILGRSKLARLVALARRVRLSVVADSRAVVDGLSDGFAGEPSPLRVLVECDTGGSRCGVQSPGDAAALARHIDAAPGLVFGGLMTYPAAGRQAAASAFLAEAKAAIEGAGLAVPVVSSGGTPDLWRMRADGVVTEYRPGTYIYNDRSLLARDVATQADCALRVVATVVSKPTPERAIIDAGTKVLTSDLLGLEGYGMVMGLPEVVIDQLSEEHGRLTSKHAIPLEVGDKVEIIPNHACVVTNMMDAVQVRMPNDTLEVWHVTARGRVT